MADIPTKTADLTATDLAELPSGMGQRFELIEGELITMPPAGNLHGAVSGYLHGELYVHVRQHKLGKLLSAETGFYTRGDERTVRAPDIAYIPSERIPKDGLPEGFSSIVPALVVEVVSPHDRAAEIEAKVEEWLTFGVSLVWVVYPKTAHVVVYHQDRTSITLKDDDLLDGEDVLSGFSLPIRSIFE